MILIIGGAYQGKENYAKKLFPAIKWKKGGELTGEELFSAQGVLGFHEYIRKVLQNGEELSDLADKLAEKNSNVILVRGSRIWDRSCRCLRTEVPGSCRPRVYGTCRKKQQGNKSGMWNRDGDKG